MTRHGSDRPRGAAVGMRAAAAALAGRLLVLLGPAPAGALAPGWTLTIDPQPDVATTRPVRVSGTARGPLHLGLGGGLVPVTSVTVALVPTTDLPAPCTAAPVRATVAPSGDRYSVELAPPCNGPYRIEVTARTELGGSGDPVVRPVGVADPGPAPPAPGASATAGGVTVSWRAARAAPDLVGWTVQGGSRDLAVGATTGRVVDAPGPGDHGYRLVARRWGASGPGGPEVASAPSSPTTVTVAALPPATVPDAPDPSVAAAPPTSGRSGPAAPPPTSRPVPPPSTAPRTSVPTGRGADAPLPAGYSEELPYGVRDDAFVPGGGTGEGASDGDGATGPRALGPSTARTVRTTERTSPGLVGPFALALVLVTVAAHVAAHLRRTRRPA